MEVTFLGLSLFEDDAFRIVVTPLAALGFAE
jgi:hypothetical protein